MTNLVNFMAHLVAAGNRLHRETDKLVPGTGRVAVGNWHGWTGRVGSRRTDQVQTAGRYVVGQISLAKVRQSWYNHNQVKQQAEAWSDGQIQQQIGSRAG